MDLMDKNIMDSILNDVKTSELPRGSISYEITESVYAGISEAGNRFLEEMHAAGAKLLVDDFDILKLIISLIEFAHRLDLKVIAEGVETKEQADFLRENGCDYFQGYYFSRPMPQEEFEALLDE